MLTGQNNFTALQLTALKLSLDEQFAKGFHMGSVQDLVEKHLKKPYTGVDASNKNLEDFLLEATESSNPFEVIPGEPANRIHFLLRQFAKECDFNGSPEYYLVVTQMMGGALAIQDNMYGARIGDMYFEALKSMVSVDSISIHFSRFHNEKSQYERVVVPFFESGYAKSLNNLDRVEELKSEVKKLYELSIRNDGLEAKSSDHRDLAVKSLTEMFAAEKALEEAKEMAAEERKAFAAEHSIEKRFAGHTQVIEYLRKNGSGFLQEPCIGVFKFMDFEDEMDYLNSAWAIFTDRNLLFVPKKIGGGIFKKSSQLNVYKLSAIRSLSVSDEHSVVHFGFDSNNWLKLHLSFTFKTGEVLTATICTGMTSDESQTYFNQRTYPLLQVLANYFPVSMSGEHIESSSGYTTSIGFGVWF